MPEDTEALATADAFCITHTEADTGGAYVRAEALVRPLPGRGEQAQAPAHRRWFEEAGPTLHVHPGKRERIEVLDGRYRVRVGLRARTLGAGESIDVPAGRAHAHWNPGDLPARIAVEHYPGTYSAEVFTALYRQAQAGVAQANGLPRPLQLAVISATYPGVVYTAWLPVWLQKLLNRAAAPIARRLGYRAD